VGEPVLPLIIAVQEDDYFELMMRNCWHISGGSGWSENTTNRRVLVTRRDGTQTVEEVPDDLTAGSTQTCKFYNKYIKCYITQPLQPTWL
jgi:hypothetical protein